MYIYKKFRFRQAWLVGTLWFSVLIAFNSRVYFQKGITPVFLLEKGQLVKNAFWYTSFRFHVAASCVALLIGMAIMLDSNLRFRRLHTIFGNLYVYLVLCIAVPTGLFMAPFAKGGFWAAAGFFINGIALWLTTWLGYQAIKRRDFTDHIRWMVRSYAFCLSAIFFRIIQLLLVLIGGMANEPAYTASVWLSLLASFIVSQSCIRLQHKNTNPMNWSILQQQKEIQT
jgi:hypothetical protein